MSKEHTSDEFEPIRIEGVITDEVGIPKNDGSRGSALYAVPFKLSQPAPAQWVELFVAIWDRPPQFTTMHRPGIARVRGDRLVLDGTTVEEVERTHQDTLRLVLKETNRKYGELVTKKKKASQVRRSQEEQHRQAVREVANRLRFDD